MVQDPKDDLQHIRQMMERSSRFISLSGLSGVVAGIIALVGAGLAYYILKQHNIEYFTSQNLQFSRQVIGPLSILAMLVLLAALALGILFTVQKSRKNGLRIWTAATKALLLNLFIPLATGGVACLAALFHGYFALVAPATLIFYGLALVNASPYTYSDIRSLGFAEIALGLLALFLLGYGLVFWALGFGVLHIVYGLVMYKKYK